MLVQIDTQLSVQKYIHNETNAITLIHTQTDTHYITQIGKYNDKQFDTSKETHKVTHLSKINYTYTTQITIKIKVN